MKTDNSMDDTESSVDETESSVDEVETDADDETDVDDMESLNLRQRLQYEAMRTDLVQMGGAPRVESQAAQILGGEGERWGER